MSGQTKDGVDPLEMSCFRSMFNCVIIFCLMKFKYKKSVINEVPKRLYKALLFRSLAGTTAFIAFTFGVKFLPITIFQVLFYLMPFWITILSFVILNESF